jgi:hypothetical protein
MALLQELGLDGCFVGRSELADIPRLSQTPDGKVVNAPVEAVGVRIAGEIFLFDPWQRDAVSAGGKPPTLATLRSNPAALRDWQKTGSLTTDAAKRWQVFLAAPLPALEPRMQWLERHLSPDKPAHLYVDLLGMRDRFEKEALAQDALRGVSCLAWNAPNDRVSLVRLQNTFSLEAKGNFIPLKAGFYESHFPRKFVPSLQDEGAPLRGKPRERIEEIFRAQFTKVFLTPNSARDQMLRGNFGNAVVLLTELRERSDRFRDLLATETFGPDDEKEWVKQANQVFGAAHRAETTGELSLSDAVHKEADFINSPLYHKLVAQIVKQTSSLLGAEACYQLALIAHERAERALTRWRHAPDDKTRREAAALCWKTALEAWQRYLDNYPELRGDFRDRDAHARRLRERCLEEQLRLSMK